MSSLEERVIREVVGMVRNMERFGAERESCFEMVREEEMVAWREARDKVSGVTEARREEREELGENNGWVGVRVEERGGRGEKGMSCFLWGLGRRLRVAW